MHYVLLPLQTIAILSQRREKERERESKSDGEREKEKGKEGEREKEREICRICISIVQNCDVDF